jgi:hypothetical protein
LADEVGSYAEPEVSSSEVTEALAMGDERVDAEGVAGSGSLPVGGDLGSLEDACVVIEVSEGAVVVGGVVRVGREDQREAPHAFRRSVHERTCGDERGVRRELVDYQRNRPPDRASTTTG